MPGWEGYLESEECRVGSHSSCIGCECEDPSHLGDNSLHPNSGRKAWENPDGSIMTSEEYDRSAMEMYGNGRLPVPTDPEVLERAFKAALKELGDG